MANTTNRFSVLHTFQQFKAMRRRANKITGCVCKSASAGVYKYKIAAFDFAARLLDMYPKYLAKITARRRSQKAPLNSQLVVLWQAIKRQAVSVRVVLLKHRHSMGNGVFRCSRLVPIKVEKLQNIGLLNWGRPLTYHGPHQSFRAIFSKVLFFIKVRVHQSLCAAGILIPESVGKLLNSKARTYA